MKEKYEIPGIIKEDHCREAAVLIPLVLVNGEDCVLFEVRSSKVLTQPGDICFPGGGLERDEVPYEAAKRETMEELLLSSSQIEITAPCSILVRHGLIIYPFLGRLHSYDFTFSDDEVSEVFTVPVSFFEDNEPKAYRSAWNVRVAPDFPYEKIKGGKDYPWPSQYENHFFYEYEGRVIWGYTAKILRSVFRKT